MAGGSLTRAARYFNRGERVLVKLRPPAAMRGVLAVTLAGCEETRTEWVVQDRGCGAARERGAPRNAAD